MKRLFCFLSIVCLSVFVMVGCNNDKPEDTDVDIQKIYGTVTDASTGRSLSGVTVALDFPNVSTVTNSSGYYEFIIENPRYLSYSITAQKEGYSTYQAFVNLKDEHYAVAVHNIKLSTGSASIKIQNAYGGDITSLDFGDDKTTLSFYIVKTGEGILNWSISYNANWIQSVSPKSGELSRGADGSDKAKELVTVTIDRSKLKDGLNSTELTITSNASYQGTQKLTIKANKETGLPYVVLQDLGIMVQKSDMGAFSYTDGCSVCSASTVGGFNDWRIPTYDELEAMYFRADEIGGFVKTTYWTSTEYYYEGSGYYYAIDFSNGTYSYYNTVQSVYRVRAVRSIH